MRIALCVEYDGTDFHGWQYQENLPTVQQALEAAISKVANHPITVICAGRTDRGVHALGQIVHFDTHAERDLRSWHLGINSNLPKTIAVRWVVEVDDDFHARFSAVKRRYKYVIYNSPVRSALLHRQMTWHLQPLELSAMEIALNHFIGEHDFSSFRGADCQAKSPIKTVYQASISAKHEVITIDITANAFLHHMVRNIVGVLLAIGQGKAKPDWVQHLLAIKDRSKAGITAPANGLYLLNVYYPETIQLPDNPLTNCFFARA